MFIIVNSPASVFLLYILLVIGSKHSLFPKIWLVLAVGIGAHNKLFLIPYFIIFSFNPDQSYLSECAVSFHKLNWNSPSLIGEPINELYAPYKLSFKLSISRFIGLYFSRHSANDIPLNDIEVATLTFL